MSLFDYYICYYNVNSADTSGDTSTNTDNDDTSSQDDSNYGNVIYGDTNPDPTWVNYDIGTLYSNIYTGELFVCTSVDSNGSTWVGQFNGSVIKPYGGPVIDYFNDASIQLFSTFNNSYDDILGNYTSVTEKPGIVYTDDSLENTALYVDGYTENSNYIKYSLTGDDINSWDAWSISFWHKYNGNGSEKPVGVSYFNSGESDFAIQFFSNNSLLVYYRSHVVIYYIPSAITTNTYIHYVIQSDNSGTYIYKNGELFGSNPNNPKSYVAGNFTVGCVIDNMYSKSYMDGSLDILRVYNRMLSDTEVKIIYNNESSYL